MTENQVKAAERLMNTLHRTRELLIATNCGGCEALQDINRRAIESNDACIRKLLDQVKFM